MDTCQHMIPRQLYLEGGMAGVNRCSYRSYRGNCSQETVFIPTADRHNPRGSGTTILAVVLTVVLLECIWCEGGRGGRRRRRERNGRGGGLSSF